METQENSESLGSRARTAAGWQFLSKGINNVLRMVTTIVLSRLLMPEDFGIVAMATIVIGLARVFQDLGLGQALVQRQEINDDHERSAFWGTLVMGALLWGVMMLISPWAGAYFEEPRMVPVLQLVALAFLLAPFTVVPKALLQRELDFRTIFFSEAAASTAYGAVGITMALLGYGYWSLAGAHLALAIARAVVLCIQMGYVPPLVPSFRGIGDLYGFGVGVTGAGLLASIATRIDYLIIGRKLDSSALGLYTRSYGLMEMPVTLIARTLAPVLFASYAQMQGDIERLHRAFARTISALSFVAFPLIILMGVSAPEFIPLIFGEQWTGSVVPFQLLAVVGLLFVVGHPGGELLRGLGKVSYLVILSATRAITLGVAVWFGTDWGINGVAAAVLAAYVVQYVLHFALIRSASGFGPLDYFRALRGSLVVMLVTLAGGTLTRFGMLSILPEQPALVLITTLVVGGAFAVAAAVLVPFPEAVEVRGELVRAAGRLREKVRQLRTSD